MTHSKPNRGAGSARRSSGSGRGARGGRAGKGGQDPSTVADQFLAELQPGALAGRWKPGPQAGLQQNKIPLTNGKEKSKSKADTITVAFWNSFGLSVERLDYLVGSQDGAVAGLDYDIIELAETQGSEQSLKQL